MGKDSDILQKDYTLKEASGNNITAKKCCQVRKRTKYHHSDPHQVCKTSHVANVYKYDNSDTVINEKLENSFQRNLIGEEVNAFHSHMARIEWLASMGRSSAIVAHELKQPLTFIRLSLDDILDKLETASLPQETIIKSLKEVLEQVSSLASAVQRFRTLAWEFPEKVANKINIQIVAERSRSVLSKNARQKRIALHLRKLDRLPSIYMNEREIEQLFFVLMENAIQAADGGKGRKLTISGVEKNHCVELRFSDNCGGIAPEHLDRIFEPFFTTKPLGQGTGLGLYVLQRIASHAGGRIRVKSEFGEGSTFFVILPINSGYLLETDC